MHTYTDKQKRTYIASFTGGISQIVSKNLLSNKIEFKTYTTDDGLASDLVQAMQEDQQGNLWILSENAISKFDAQRETFENYGLNSLHQEFSFSEAAPVINARNQIVFGTVKEAWNMGAVAVGATIYFGSEQSRRQLVEIADAFEYAHELGMATVLWCYLRNSSFKKDGIDYSAAADLTGQANHLGVTIKADIIKQKLPENNGGFTAINFGKIDQKMYTELTTEHPIDLCRYQVANNYMGRVGLINSGGESHGASDLKDAVVTAVINKRAGGMGLISGRKAFQRPMKDGVELLHSIQDIYLDKDITIA